MDPIPPLQTLDTFNENSFLISGIPFLRSLSIRERRSWGRREVDVDAYAWRHEASIMSPAHPEKQSKCAWYLSLFS